MSIEEDFCCNAIFGTVLMKKYGSNEPLMDIGNVTAVAINNTNSEISTPSGKTLGGTACKLIYTSEARLNLTMSCLKAKNIATALSGTGSYQNIAEATIEDESHDVEGVYESIVFERVPDPTAEVTLTDSTGSTTYEEGTDYIRTPVGVDLIDGGNISVEDELLISYTHGKNTVIDALKAASGMYQLYIAGKDYGNNETPVKVKIHKLQLGPTTEWNIIEAGRTTFAELVLDGEILQDETITNERSKFYFVEYGEKR